ncbi:hypothetical protein PCI56_15310 [Plesiomonas shigelloides subsp. oncorhynchi]|nr:hypothetical protein [Plesiomonas shigelloides]
MLVAIGVSLLMLLFVIPQFEQIYTSFGSELPAFTNMVLGLSQLLREKGLYVLRASWPWCLLTAILIVNPKKCVTSKIN